VFAGTASIPIEEIARVWYRAPQLLPADVDPGGLEVTAGYKPKVDSGTFSYATHGVVVAVDPAVGTVELLTYIVVEDGGTIVNPLIVDGQVFGGAAQGIGTAMYEEMPFSSDGQPLATTLGDYLLPSAAEVPHIAIDHMTTPSPFTEFGVKGLGEGGAIAPPAAIANAVNDALRPLGVPRHRDPDHAAPAPRPRWRRPARRRRHEARTLRLRTSDRSRRRARAAEHAGSARSS